MAANDGKGAAQRAESQRKKTEIRLLEQLVFSVKLAYPDVKAMPPPVALALNELTAFRSRG